jgi:hypothetical protein
MGLLQPPFRRLRLAVHRRRHYRRGRRVWQARQGGSLWRLLHLLSHIAGLRLLCLLCLLHLLCAAGLHLHLLLLLPAAGLHLGRSAAAELATQQRHIIIAAASQPRCC